MAPERFSRLFKGAIVVCATLWAGAVLAQTDAPVARDMREEARQISVTVKDLYGRQETRQIPVTIFRPKGEGPFPLVIMNHGRTTSDKRAMQGIQRYEALSRYLVGKGFAVLLPTRVGYAQTFGDFDPEASGDCRALRVEPMAMAASDQVLATLEFAKTLPFVDATRWLVMGQSVGGLAAVATVGRQPAGLVGAVNFSGGAGGDPDKNPGNPCSPQQVAGVWGSLAKSARVNMLWLYWQNDLYWGTGAPRRWHEAWTSNGGLAEFQSLPAAGPDGHAGLNIDMDHWVPLVEDYLLRLGFTQPGTVSRPAPSGFAKVDEVDKLPANQAAKEGAYRKFLESKSPRAFALGPNNAAGWSTGDWAMGRALGFCARRGEACKLYAVDDDVVWAP
jgi:dienelactone hydrolase